MSKKLNAEQTGESVVVAVRLPPDLLTGLDRVVAQAARPPFSSPSRSEVARGLIETALHSLGALEAAATAPAPVLASAAPPPTPAPAAAPPKPARKAPAPAAAPARASIGEAVLAALRAAERAGDDLLDVAAVVRIAEGKGYTREETQAELVRLGTAGVDVLELRPDSGGGNERKEDRAIVPQGLDGTPLLEARWKNRPTESPAVAETNSTDEQLRARLKAHREATKKTERQVADASGIQKDRLNRWTNGTKKNLNPEDHAKLAKYLDSVGA